MMRYQWDTLRVGDAVLIHDSEGGKLVAAKVAFVTEAEVTGDANTIGVRVADADETYYAWPALHDVHPDPLDAAEPCARCADAGATQGAAPAI